VYELTELVTAQVLDLRFLTSLSIANSHDLVQILKGNL